MKTWLNKDARDIGEREKASIEKSEGIIEIQFQRLKTRSICWCKCQLFVYSVHSLHKSQLFIPSQMCEKSRECLEVYLVFSIILLRFQLNYILKNNFTWCFINLSFIMFLVSYCHVSWIALSWLCAAEHNQYTNVTILMLQHLIWNYRMLLHIQGERVTWSSHGIRRFWVA